MTDKKKKLSAAERRVIERDRRKRQSATRREKYGPDVYSKMGSKGGLKSPTKFTSESARIAAARSVEVRQQKREAAESNHKNENGLQTNEQK